MGTRIPKSRQCLRGLADSRNLLGNCPTYSWLYGCWGRQAYHDPPSTQRPSRNPCPRSSWRRAPSVFRRFAGGWEGANARQSGGAALTVLLARGEVRSKKQKVKLMFTLHAFDPAYATGRWHGTTSVPCPKEPPRLEGCDFSLESFCYLFPEIFFCVLSLFLLALHRLWNKWGSSLLNKQSAPPADNLQSQPRKWGSSCWHSVSSRSVWVPHAPAHTFWGAEAQGKKGSGNITHAVCSAELCKVSLDLFQSGKDGTGHVVRSVSIGTKNPAHSSHLRGSHYFKRRHEHDRHHSRTKSALLTRRFVSSRPSSFALRPACSSPLHSTGGIGKYTSPAAKTKLHCMSTFLGWATTACRSILFITREAKVKVCLTSCLTPTGLLIRLVLKMVVLAP